uniref:Uncharacterized protein n=1 Tax=Oryza meridionalis TaxID=40149 RepID=A0A0E0CAR1_9ORYZ
MDRWHRKECINPVVTVAESHVVYPIIIAKPQALHALTEDMAICLRRSRTQGQFILKITTQLTLQQQFNDNILLAVKSRKILSDYKWIQTSNLYLSTRYMSSHAETNEAMAATTLL